MKVDTMRNIDRYAGVPITFLLGLIYRLVYLVTPRKQVPVRNALLLSSAL